MNSFPRIYEEECLYGLKGRLLRDTLSNEANHPNNYLGEIKHLVISLDLPSHIGQFHEATKHLVQWSVESIIENHTLYPIYRPFLIREKQSKVMKSMISSERENIHAIVGINASNLDRNNYPKFCPVCSNEDLNKYGEAYWHRIHQFPDIQICPDHNCFLIEYKTEIKDLRGFKYLLLSNGLIYNSPVRFNECKTLADVSADFKNILLGHMTFDINNVDYQPKIISKGYFKNGKIQRADLQREFQKFYQSTVNDYLRLNISESYNWIGNVVHHPQMVFNPFQHLLFSRFIDSMDFNQFPKKEHPFGTGPWKCFNKVSDHYLKKVITEFQLKFDKKNNRTVGIFKCQCGMIYSSYFAVKGGDLKERIRVKKRGKEWSEKLEECNSVGMSLRETARVLGTDASSVSKLLKRKKPNDRYKIKEQVPSKRKQWKSAMQEFEMNEYSESRKKYPTLYRWLFRYDHDWLLSTKTHNNNLECRQRLDWKKLDDQLLSEIQEVLAKLRAEKLSVRISKTLIGKLVSNGKYILSTKLKDLPKAKNFLTKNMESTTDFQTRQIENAARAIIDEGRPLTKWNVIKASKIGKHPIIVNRKIESIVETEMSNFY